MLRLSSERIPRGDHAARVFYLALLFVVTATATVLWSRSMAAMGGDIPMPGGWTLSMMWTPMCGQGWTGAALSFLGMWSVMMTAMMLPSIAPLLGRCHGPAAATAAVAAGYAAVWLAAGLAVFAGGATLAEIGPHWPALMQTMPLLAGMVVLLAGLSQFTGWKARHLAGCRALPMQGPAWRAGLGLGLHCLQSSAGPTAILLVLGMMDLRAMAAVTVVITLERLAPAGLRVAPITGAVAVLAGVVMVARAAAAFLP
jgi:predicted metal-binding membrane protein